MNFRLLSETSYSGANDAELVMSSAPRTRLIVQVGCPVPSRLAYYHQPRVSSSLEGLHLRQVQNCHQVGINMSYHT